MSVCQGAQGGFAAIAALFLVVALAALGGFMLTFSSAQQLTSAQDVRGSRAYWIARAGLEWAVVAIPPIGLATPDACTVTGPPASIDGFTISISGCTKATYADTGVTSGVAAHSHFPNNDYCINRERRLHSRTPTAASRLRLSNEGRSIW